MPKLTRRSFLKLGAGGAITSVLGPKVLKAMELNLAGESYNFMVLTERRAVPYVTCDAKLKNSAIAFVEDGKVVQVGGDPNHPGTRGRLSPQENVVSLAIYDPDRILYPLKRTGQRGSGKWKRISWEDAVAEVSKRLEDALEKRDPEEICLNIGKNPMTGGWLRFMHALGSDTILRQDSMGDGSKRTAMLHTWGAEIETPDFANSKYILNFGSNLFETFQPYAQMVTDGRVDNHARLVTFDVRISNTSGLSDEWIPIFPGTDGLVALAMANVIMEEGLADTEFINTWTNYPAEKLAEHLKTFTPEMAAEKSGVPAKEIKRIAIEFATTKPATIFTYRGVSTHYYGAYQERACMLLPVITGNVEVKGGYCLPRYFSLPDIDPVPPKPKEVSIPGFPLGSPDYLLPFWIKEGKKVSILFNYASNPAYSCPASSYWRETLKDEALIPYIVEFGSKMTETAELADIILPDAHHLESNELFSGPSSLWPWLGLTQPAVTPLGESRDIRMVLKELALRIDGKYGVGDYFNFEDGEDWIRKQVENIPILSAEGGYDLLRKNGVWPRYGTLNSGLKRLTDKEGSPIKAEYGIYKKGLSSEELKGSKVDPKTGVITRDGKAVGIRVNGKSVRGFDTPTRRIHIYVEEFKKHGFDPLPTWKEVPWHKGLKKEEMVLTTYKVFSHTNSATANNKYLAEFIHSNPVLINKGTAEEMGIKDGALVRVTSTAGYIVTKARATQGIHPKVVAISTSFGHWAGGRVARLGQKEHPPEWLDKQEDPDIEHNLWWRDKGVHPNDIILPAPDPIGGSQGWGDTVVKVTPAEPGDRYGDIKVDNSRHYTFYKDNLKRR